MHTRHVVVLLCLSALASASYYASSTSTSSPTKLPAIKVDPNTHHFVDATGRTRIFHGVNAVVKIPPFHPDVTSFNPVDSLVAQDMELLQKYGFTAVRLGVMWPGVETARGVYNDTYLEVMSTLTNQLADYGIYTLVDVHQDVLSPKFCGEGAPDYAAQPSKLSLPFPLPVPEIVPRDPDTGYPNITDCQKLLFFDYYLSTDASTAFQNLYDNYDDIQDSFGHFWNHVATHFANNTNVLGYELLNEPWAGDVYADPQLFEFGKADKDNLQPMYQKLQESIRAADSEHVILYEPCVINYGPVGFTETPGGPDFNDRQALAYHLYCPYINTTTGDPINDPACAISYDGVALERLSDVERLGGGLYMTEFGAHDDTTKGIDALIEVMDACDNNGIVSWNYWMYKTYHDITTQSSAESFYFANGTLQLAKIKALSRTYAYAIAGVPTQASWVGDTATFILSYLINTEATAPTELFVNVDAWYPDGYTLSFNDNSLVESYNVTAQNRVSVWHSAAASNNDTLVITVAPAP